MLKQDKQGHSVILLYISEVLSVWPLMRTHTYTSMKTQRHTSKTFHIHTFRDLELVVFLEPETPFLRVEDFDREFSVRAV